MAPRLRHVLSAVGAAGRQSAYAEIGVTDSAVSHTAPAGGGFRTR